jgi:hypothetical protein
MSYNKSPLITINQNKFQTKVMPTTLAYNEAQSILMTHGLGIAPTMVKLRFKSLLRRLIGGNNA